MVRVSVALHLSRLLIGAGRSGTDPYSLHQLLWRAFQAPGRARPFLFRADLCHGDEGSRPALKVLVQSEVPPEWERVDGVEFETRPWAPELCTGDAFRFFLRANPTRARKDRHQFGELGPEEFRAARGKRVPIWDPEARDQWLIRKATESGFEVTGVRTSNARPWRWRRGENRAVHDGVDFEGTLRVIEPSLLAAALASGIGAGKAFGFGLLSVAPLRKTDLDRA